MKAWCKIIRKTCVKIRAKFSYECKAIFHIITRITINDISRERRTIVNNKRNTKSRWVHGRVHPATGLYICLERAPNQTRRIVPAARWRYRHSLVAPPSRRKIRITTDTDTATDISNVVDNFCIRYIHGGHLVYILNSLFLSLSLSLFLCTYSRIASRIFAQNEQNVHRQNKRERERLFAYTPYRGITLSTFTTVYMLHSVQELWCYSLFYTCMCNSNSGGVCWMLELSFERRYMDEGQRNTPRCCCWLLSLTSRCPGNATAYTRKKSREKRERERDELRLQMRWDEMNVKEERGSTEEVRYKVHLYLL